MKLISTSEDSYVVNSSYLGASFAYPMDVVSPRVTQISSDDASIGGIVQRADSFRAVYVSEPIVIVTVKAFDLSGTENPNFLSEIQISSSVVSFDTYFAGTQASFSDTYNFDAQLFATRGRLVYDLQKFATSQVRLTVLNRSISRRIVKIKVEVYSKDENIHFRPEEYAKASDIQIHTVDAAKRDRDANTSK